MPQLSSTNLSTRQHIKNNKEQIDLSSVKIIIKLITDKVSTCEIYVPVSFAL